MVYSEFLKDLLVYLEYNWLKVKLREADYLAS